MDNKIEASTVLCTNQFTGEVGYYSGDNCWTPWNWNQYYPTYYPLYVSPVEDKISKSFRIVSKLIEKGIVKNITIAEFISLVSEISNLL